jgi:hypothetical protein
MRRYLVFALCLSLSGCYYCCCDDDDDHDDNYYGPPSYGGWPSDFNVDGFADILVGAPLDDAGVPGSDRGRVFLYAGWHTPEGVADGVYDGTEDGGQFGASVASVGDFNGDGWWDFAVGAPFESGGGTRRGRVHVYYGGPVFPSIASIVLNGAEDDGRFGWAVAGAGDVNGDGRDELLVGAPLENSGGTRRGRAYLFSFTNGSTPLLTFSGSENDSRFGWALDTAGDYNWDGYSDVAIGAPLDDADGNTTDNGQDRGRVFLYLGSPTPDNGVDFVLPGAEIGGEFGSAVAGLGDFNYDGFDDLAVGAPFDDGDGNALDDGTDRGRAFVFYGGYLFSDVPDHTVTGTAGSRFGAMVARTGDINNGGAPDLLVGAPYEGGGGTERGRAYLFYGGSLPDLLPSVVLSGIEDGGHFGSSGFSGGDVNAGGARDLVIGAPDDDGDGNTTEDGPDRGRAFLFFGGPSMDALPDLVVGGGPETGARAGAAVQ